MIQMAGSTQEHPWTDVVWHALPPGVTSPPFSRLRLAHPTSIGSGDHASVYLHETGLSDIPQVAFKVFEEGFEYALKNEFDGLCHLQQNAVWASKKPEGGRPHYKGAVRTFGVATVTTPDGPRAGMLMTAVWPSVTVLDVYQTLNEMHKAGQIDEQRLDSAQRLLARWMAKDVRYVGTARMTHGDAQPHNWLVGRSARTILSDFERYSTDDFPGFGGADEYQPPEARDNVGYAGGKHDAFTLGASYVKGVDIEKRPEEPGSGGDRLYPKRGVFRGTFEHVDANGETQTISTHLEPSDYTQAAEHLMDTDPEKRSTAALALEKEPYLNDLKRGKEAVREDLIWAVDIMLKKRGFA